MLLTSNLVQIMKFVTSISLCYITVNIAELLSTTFTMYYFDRQPHQAPNK